MMPAHLAAKLLAGNSRYEPLGVLGHGAQGLVISATDTASGHVVAIKFISRAALQSKHLQREVLHHRELQHPHIVRFLELIATPDCLGIVQEYCNGGTLRSFIKQHGCLHEHAARWFFQQLLIALDYMHRLQHCHRDLKLDNTLLHWQDDLPQEANGVPTALLKIADFGYSKAGHESAPKSKVGTLLYMAPEMILSSTSDSYDGKLADVWSCGVMLYEMLFGCNPFYHPAGTGAAGTANAAAAAAAAAAAHGQLVQGRVLEVPVLQQHGPGLHGPGPHGPGPHGPGPHGPGPHGPGQLTQQGHFQDPAQHAQHAAEGWHTQGQHALGQHAPPGQPPQHIHHAQPAAAHGPAPLRPSPPAASPPAASPPNHAAGMLELKATVDRITAIHWSVPDGHPVSAPCLDVLRCMLTGVDQRASVQDVQQMAWFRLGLAPGAEQMNDMLLSMDLSANVQPVEVVLELLGQASGGPGGQPAAPQFVRHA